MTAKQNDELKSCPFCGVLPESRTTSICRCPNGHTPWMTFADWNARYVEPTDNTGLSPYDQEID